MFVNGFEKRRSEVAKLKQLHTFKIIGRANILLNLGAQIIRKIDNEKNPRRTIQAKENVERKLYRFFKYSLFIYTKAFRYKNRISSEK